MTLNMSEATAGPGWRGVNDGRKKATANSFSHCWADVGEQEVISLRKLGF